ncbi:MarR family winged helix-turn-helix transcriptional regulator [Streptomyces sp. NPDC054796]
MVDAERAPSGAGELNRDVLARMRRITQLHTSLWQERVPELTKPQYGVVRALADAPAGLSQAAVGERVAMDKATLAQLIPRLEARGLVVRAVAPEDRRRRVLKLTPEGARTVRDLSPRVESLDEETLSPLPLSDRHTLQRLLTDLAE